MATLEKFFKVGEWIKFNDSIHIGPEKYKKLSFEEAKKYNLNSILNLQTPEKVDIAEVKFYYEVKIQGCKYKIRDFKKEGLKEKVEICKKDLKLYQTLFKKLKKEELNT